jgi:hypothetical protein
LRAADDGATTVHARHDFAYPGVNFFQADYFGLESAMERATDGPQRECDEVRILLQSNFEALVVAAVVESLHAAGNLESAGETGYDVTISLAVKFDLAGFVLHELGLVAAFNGAEFVGAAAGKQSAGEGEGEQADQEQDSQNDIEETDSSELFEHSWNLGFTIAAGIFAAEVVGFRMAGRPFARRTHLIIVDQLRMCQRYLALLNTNQFGFKSPIRV